MKKISKAELKETFFKKGWEVDKVSKAKPKRVPTPLIKEQVADSVSETNRAIQEMALAMKSCFNEQLEKTSGLLDLVTKVSDRKIIVELPETKTANPKKKKWRFTVSRDGRGFIENIIAEEI